MIDAYGVRLPCAEIRSNVAPRFGYEDTNIFEIGSFLRSSVQNTRGPTYHQLKNKIENHTAFLITCKHLKYRFT